MMILKSLKETYETQNWEIQFKGKYTNSPYQVCVSKGYLITCSAVESLTIFVRRRVSFQGLQVPVKVISNTRLKQ